MAWGAIGLAIGSACASTSLPRIPPVTEEPTQLVKPGKFVWVDLVTQDVANAKSFYGALFGWTFLGGDRYTQVLHDGTAIAGIVRAADPERGSEWVGNLSVADVDRAAALVSERGGVVEREPVNAPERGRLALVSDPEGALLLLLRASGGDPPDAEPTVGSWLWRELWTHDVDSAAAFYAALAGYEPETVEFRGHPYHVLKGSGVPRAGVVSAPPEVNPLWLPYVRVEDPGDTAARAATLGARIVMQDEHGAILVDPTGAPIGIQAWAGSDGQGAEGAR
jgi:predicted enzyme related to lactoylglutathione lyase